MEIKAWPSTIRTLILTEIYQTMQIAFHSYVSSSDVLKLPNPVNMNAARLAELGSSWFVTFKADGVRCLWVRAIVRQTAVELTINRKCQITSIKVIDHHKPEVEGIIHALDCELVDGKYICHDVLIFDRVPVLFRAFEKRINVLYLLHDRQDLPQPKSFYPCSQIDMVPYLGDGYVFISSFDKFETGKTESIVKWKPPQDISIDLLVKDTSVLMASNTGLVSFSGSLTEYELSLKDCNGHVVEFTFCSTSSCWYPYRIRYDKSIPNNAFVVQETIQSLQSPILLDRLVARCKCIK